MALKSAITDVVPCIMGKFITVSGFVVCVARCLFGYLFSLEVHLAPKVAINVLDVVKRAAALVNMNKVVRIE